MFVVSTKQFITNLSTRNLSKIAFIDQIREMMSDKNKKHKIVDCVEKRFGDKESKGDTTNCLSPLLLSNSKSVQAVRKCTPLSSVDEDSSITTHSNHSSSTSSLSSSTFGMEAGKDAAARACALKHIKNGSRIGVGSGSTVKYFVNYLKEKVEAGELKDIECVPTSFLTRKWLLDANLPTKTPDTLPSLDVCVDGADEVDSSLNCIKGGGGCLTQEKIVQASAAKFYIIADSTKQANFLGERWKTIPLEMVPFGYVPAINRIHKELGGRCELRMAHKKCGPVITDNNGYIVDWHFPQSYCNKEHEWKKTNDILINIPGVVETGLFLNVADEVFFATNEGAVNHISK